MAVQTDSQSSKTNKATLLRRALLGNSLFSAMSGIALIIGARPIATFIGIQAPLALAGLGAVLALYAIALYYIATQEPIDTRAALVAIELDVAWVAGSAVLLFSNWLPLTTEGKWAIAIIAEIVAVFAVVQYLGLRKMRGA